MLRTLPRALARPTTLAAAVTLAGAGMLVPISAAHAVTAPTSIPQKLDKAGFLDDAFSVGVEAGIAWYYSIDGGALIKVTDAGNDSTTVVKPFKTAPKTGAVTVSYMAIGDTAETEVGVLEFSNKPAVALPLALVKADAAGYKSDSFTVPKAAPGITWAYKVGATGTLVPIDNATAAVVVKPWASATSPTTASTDVIVTATAGSGYGFTSATAAKSPYKITFNTAKIPVVTKNPVFLNKPGTTNDTIALPKLAGASWEVVLYDKSEAKIGEKLTVGPSDYLKDGKPISSYTVMLDAGVTYVDVSMVADAEHSLSGAVKPTLHFFSYTLPVPAEVDPAAVSFTKSDNPGSAADCVLLTGVAGVQWKVGATTYQVKPGAIKKIPLSLIADTGTEITASPLPDYVFKGTAQTKSQTFQKSDFTAKTSKVIKARVSGLKADIYPDKAVKSYTFTPTGKTVATTLAIPVGATFVTYELSAGTLVANAAAGYSLTPDRVSGGVVSGDNVSFTIGSSSAS